MVHNLNTARHLAEGDVVRCTFFSDNHAQDLACNDTESMKLDFSDGAAAHLFITWAADLEIYDPTKNDREHIDIFYMVTDRGWRLTDGEDAERAVIRASREGKQRTWPVEPLAATAFDRFARAAADDAPLPPDVPDVREAYEDVKILQDARQRPGARMAVDLAAP
jgi:predicted dehydrogenase